jgi:hypothetical protein
MPAVSPVQTRGTHPLKFRAGLKKRRPAREYVARCSLDGATVRAASARRLVDAIVAEWGLQLGRSTLLRLARGPDAGPPTQNGLAARCIQVSVFVNDA